MCTLYLADLTGMGMVQPDEPRYADIGRAMARTGNWVTPHLWGHPWFEKPALLYWMTAAGFRLGLGPDLAPRLPIALLSLLFLAFFWVRLDVEFGRRAASFATAMLATSAGWLAYSHVAVTDVPMASFFSAAVLLSLGWVSGSDRSLLPAAAACLGFATLAKGLVPVVLFLPVAASPLFTGGSWRRLLDWLRPRPVLAFSVCALPWYFLVTLRNGTDFIRVFFLQQQFGRFTSSALQHVQPFWFYVPALLLLLYPWFPILAFPSMANALRNLSSDPRVRTLTSVVVFGFVFFSASVNKLYGYLIPLLPAIFALLGLGLARARRIGFVLFPSLLLLSLLPAISEFAPRVMASHLGGLIVPAGPILVFMLLACIIGVTLVRFAPRYAFPATATFAAIGFVWFQFATFPAFDRYASARPLWNASHPQCTGSVPRDILYGLYYYSGRELPPCPVLDPDRTRVVR